MQTCTKCNHLSADSARFCHHCGADLKKTSHFAVALKNLKNNPRVLAIRIAAPADACSVCNELTGTYDKQSVPELPVEGCSDVHGCQCFYEPVLDFIYP